MGEPNNALAVYMNRPERIRDLLEYYLGAGLPEDWECEEMRGVLYRQEFQGEAVLPPEGLSGKSPVKGREFPVGSGEPGFRQSDLPVAAYGAGLPGLWKRG